MRRLSALAVTTAAASVVALGTVAVPAQAAPGVKGGIGISFIRDCYPATKTCPANKVHLRAYGYAVNLKTKPTQSVVAIVSHRSSARAPFHQIYRSGEHLADGKVQYDPRSIPKAYRKYSFFWNSVGFPYYGENKTNSDINYRTCFYAHDKGEKGGFVRFACYNGLG